MFCVKRYLYSIIVLILCTALLLAGCGDNKADSATENATQDVTEADTYGYDTTSPKSAEWFDNAVFVGDSVTLKLSYYCESNPDALGEAAFFCGGNLGYTNALWDIDDPSAVHPYYQGEIHLAEDCAKATGKDNVFIMLGMNDIGLYGVDGAMESCKTVISHLAEKSPNAHIYNQSVTPMIEKAQVDSFNNTLVKEFDGKLKEFCETNHYKYLDVFSALADENGNLPEEYCSDPDDMGLHFTDSACKIWADYLKENA